MPGLEPVDDVEVGSFEYLQRGANLPQFLRNDFCVGDHRASLAQADHSNPAGDGVGDEHYVFPQRNGPGDNKRGTQNRD
jgi:hypothetical protein